ncbi:M16 family metallopeptidase [Alicyclobacillus kakegawensis]|uniref:M16 family metallopeptidase n=1 Tax=Alicyclobacillus kakegawensis TaxID=392012 RepID=UPI0009F882EB|nr:pitrilysin family protein [Alicyclobacillus kakegawensis]
MTYRVVLDNGVRVVGEEIPSMRSVSMGIWIGTGSRFETKNNNGISHFLEHMLFKGTHRLSARELAMLFDEIGGHVNAFTSKEYTCFYAKVLDEHFDTAIETLADMFFDSQFYPEEMEKEKKVILEEIRMYEDTPDELVMDVIAEGAYRDHPLGYTILGLEDNLLAFTRADLLEYVASHYRPERVVVAIAGNIPEDRAVDTVRRLFGRAFAASAQRTAEVSPPSFDARVTVREKDIEQVHICLAAPGLAAGDERLYPLILLNNALGSAPSSKLFQEIREERGLAYSVFSFHSAYQDCGMFGVYTGTSPEHVDTVLERIYAICEDLAKKGLTDNELQKCKQQVKSSIMLSLESTSSRMSRLGKNELVLGREVPLDETLARINGVTVADVKAMAAWLLQQDFALAAVGPVTDSRFARWVR